MSRSSSVTHGLPPRAPRPARLPRVATRPWRLVGALALATAAAAAGSACLRFDPFGCQEDTQCDAEAMGRCDATGWCTYPDLACTTGYRYEANAGDGLGGECVGSDPGTGSGSATSSMDTEPVLDTGQDDDTLTTTTGPEPTDTDGTTGDACGGSGQACCPGDACDSGLSCSEGLCGCVQAVAVGDRHTCVIKLDGGVACWGANDLGQLAADPLVTPMSATPLDVAGLPAADGLLARRHTCALASGDVLCWGDNTNQKAVLGNLEPLVLTPTLVDLPAPVEELGVGGSHSCAGMSGGQAPYCWGDNASGQLTGAEATGLGIVPGVDPFFIATGAAHTCMSALTGELHCWGSNTFGQLGVDPATTPSTNTPQLLGTLLVGMIVAGSEHSCATVGTDVQCWGRNDLGQLGNGTTTSAYTASVAMLPPGAGNVSSLVAAADQTCAVTAGGTVLCWGGNQNGELLLTPDESGEDGFALSPRVIELGFAVAQLATGVTHSCALGTDGQVRCWGANAQGQIGDGTVTDALEPTQAQISCP